VVGWVVDLEVDRLGLEEVGDFAWGRRNHGSRSECGQGEESGKGRRRERRRFEASWRRRELSLVMEVVFFLLHLLHLLHQNLSPCEVELVVVEVV
jgi:hypothetical protein